jgi:hypothetical protein
MSAEVEWKSHERSQLVLHQGKDANFGEIVASRNCYAVQLPLETPSGIAFAMIDRSK